MATLHKTLQKALLTPGMATGYRPAASGSVGGGASKAYRSGPNASFELTACSHVTIWPD
jgi:hypothetical protein